MPSSHPLGCLFSFFLPCPSRSKPTGSLAPALPGQVPCGWDAAVGGDGQQDVYAFSLGLAWANPVFTAWNLFGFLLLRALPVYMYFDKGVETPTGARGGVAYTLLPIPKTTKQM